MFSARMTLAGILRAARRLALCLAGAAAILLGLLTPAGSAGAGAVSSNWAGYVATPASTGDGFSSISGSWTEPSISCRRGRGSYSAVWVGLGGANERATALEQVGTDADCTRSGKATYSSWFELLPAGAVDVNLTVHPGDQITASATVRGRHATLRLRDLSTGKRFAFTRHLSAVDVSSADWIVEAPSVCTPSGRSCKTEALSSFSEVAFTAASATLRGHTGAITDPDWSPTALELRQGSHQGSGSGAASLDGGTGTLIVAAPSALDTQGAFTVTRQEQEVRGERSTPPTLPSSSGGVGAG